jgi:TPR repeat protein
MIAYGRGAAQDASRSMEIFRRCSLDFNHAPSMRYLGIFAANGHGMAEERADYNAAVAWFDKCARTEDPTVSSMCERERDELKDKINLAQREVAARAKK